MKKKEATLCVLFYCSLAFGASVSHIEACTLMGFFFTIFLCRAKLRGFLRGNENLTNMHCVGLLCYSTSKWTAKHPLFLGL